jgi:hypothetical protein
MIYITKLIYFSILVLCSVAVQAQDTRYRVEILVLTHLNHSEDPLESEEISDYSPAIDFLTPAEEPEETEQKQAPLQETADQPTQLLTGEEGLPQEEPEPDPNAVVQIEGMGEAMQEAWRRLRLSAPFRPQQYLSWEQGEMEPFPVLRVHDLETILFRDPHAEERLALLEADLLESESEQQEQVFADPAGISKLEDPELSGMPEEPGLPGPSLYYRLDGTVILKRSRFLHLDLDIQLREGIWEPEPLEIVALDPVIFERAGPTAFLVQELQQSRQVKTGRMEYFDGPVLSVLAFITSIKVSDAGSP